MPLPRWKARSRNCIRWMNLSSRARRRAASSMPSTRQTERRSYTARTTHCPRSSKRRLPFPTRRTAPLTRRSLPCSTPGALRRTYTACRLRMNWQRCSPARGATRSRSKKRRTAIRLRCQTAHSLISAASPRATRPTCCARSLKKRASRLRRSTSAAMCSSWGGRATAPTGASPSRTRQTQRATLASCRRRTSSS